MACRARSRWLQGGVLERCTCGQRPRRQALDVVGVCCIAILPRSIRSRAETKSTYSSSEHTWSADVGAQRREIGLPTKDRVFGRRANSHIGRTSKHVLTSKKPVCQFFFTGGHRNARKIALNGTLYARSQVRKSFAARTPTQDTETAHLMLIPPLYTDRNEKDVFNENADATCKTTERATRYAYHPTVLAKLK